mmetsp:Transcript_15339/g.24812  ORF Transcript_15339/g.24812 Transcript_15339/m.24812 type:complete len:232 (+) Transcript_15339:1180-1875(+)
MPSKVRARKPRVRIICARSPVPAPTSSTSLPSGGQNSRNVSTHALGDAKPSFCSESCSYASAQASYASITSPLAVLKRLAARSAPCLVTVSSLTITTLEERGEVLLESEGEQELAPPEFMESTESEGCRPISRTPVAPPVGEVYAGCTGDTLAGDRPRERPTASASTPSPASAAAATARGLARARWSAAAAAEARVAKKAAAAASAPALRGTLASTRLALRISPAACISSR